MRGIVVKFDAEKGYGFIRSGGLAHDVFVHISNVRDKQALVPGQNADFETEETEKGLAAIHVIPGRIPASPFALYGIPALIAAIALSIFLTFKGWRALPAYLASINLCTFIYYGYDKLLAKTHWLRIPERVLHGLAFMGGSPAALIARKTFRHKTIKRSFLFTYWIIVLMQIALLLAMMIYWNE